MKHRISVLIVDDEALARDGVRLRFKGDADFEIIGEAAGGREAVALIRKLRPDVVFLDIQMPELDGFGVLATLKDHEVPIVVFVTAFDEYAVAAFESQAVDYVLKPINPRRFAKTLERIKLITMEKSLARMSRDFVANLREAVSESSEPRKLRRRFAIKEHDRIFFIDADQVDWIEAENYYAALHVGKKKHLIRESLSELEEQLDPNLFVRVHRSAIVNIRRVREVKRPMRGGYLLVLDDGSKLKLGRSYHQTIQRILDQRR